MVPWEFLPCERATTVRFGGIPSVFDNLDLARLLPPFRAIDGGGGVTRKELDLKPGVLPEIDAVDGSVIFRMAIAGRRPHEELIIRCDLDGDIWLSIPDAIE